MLTDPLVLRVDQVIDKETPTGAEIPFSRIAAFGVSGKSQESQWQLLSSFSPTEGDSLGAILKLTKATVRLAHTWTSGGNVTQSLVQLRGRIPLASGRMAPIKSSFTLIHDTELSAVDPYVAGEIEYAFLIAMRALALKSGRIDGLLNFQT